MSIKELRKEKNITQAQLAEACGLNVRWIQKLENGEIDIENITLKNATLLLKGFDALGIEAGKQLEGANSDYAILRSAYIIIRELLKG